MSGSGSLSPEKALEPTRLQATTFRYPARRDSNVTSFGAFGQDFARSNLHYPRAHHRPGTQGVSAGAMVYPKGAVAKFGLA